jgi:uncharacterized repeat protein (TIGR03803 family)
MRSDWLTLLLCLSVLSLRSLSAAQSNEQVIYAFAGKPDCNGPAAALVADPAGDLYGTANGGAFAPEGCVFELLQTSSGWIEKVLYSFTGGTDGAGPDSGLLLGSNGTLFGTTVTGGAYGRGTVFELTPTSSGEWSETVLHSFGSGNDGAAPQSNLIFDSKGNLYGTTAAGNGKRGGGSVFRLSPGSGGWNETVLYLFPSQIGGPDGDGAIGGVVMDKVGNLYGVTLGGGAYGAGAVFELALTKGGRYKESIIHSFDVTDGFVPQSGLSIDRQGNLWGTTSSGGGGCQCGVVFELQKTGNAWTETVVHAFNGTDGGNALGPVAFDSLGNLYVVGMSGGANGQGTVIELTASGPGMWNETVLHNFDFIFPNGADGQHPYAGVTIDHGHLYGTTSSGGVNDEGVVFEIALPNP